jgi:catechol 2,3-dioxygenase-like lactoylglutathione lyase family enzyme
MVPDIVATQTRMEDFGVPIIKRLGDSPEPTGVLAGAFALIDPAIVPAALAGTIALRFDRVLMVADPDGNLIEIQQQVNSN